MVLLCTVYSAKNIFVRFNQLDFTVEVVRRLTHKELFNAPLFRPLFWSLCARIGFMAFPPAEISPNKKTPAVNAREKERERY